VLTVDCDLIGTAPLGFSRAIQSVKNHGESSAAFEERTWRERMHVDADGYCYIPPTALKNCLADIAKYRSDSVPGKGKKTYTKYFESGLLVTQPLSLGVKASEVVGTRLHVPSDGKRGGGTRVWRVFPTLPQWKTHATIYVLEPMLIDKVAKVKEYLEDAGKFIGLMFFRPARNGFWGRFRIENFKTS